MMSCEMGRKAPYRVEPAGSSSRSLWPPSRITPDSNRAALYQHYNQLHQRYRWWRAPAFDAQQREEADGAVYLLAQT